MDSTSIKPISLINDYLVK